MEDYIQVDYASDGEALPYIEHLLLCHQVRGWVEKDPGGITFYIPDNAEGQKLLSDLQRLLPPGVVTATSLLRGEEWEHSWKQHFTLQKIGSFVVKPTWEDYSSDHGEIVIEMDPGMAFGTGDHPTTALCLELLLRYMKQGYRVLDLGTGSGILAIAAAYLQAEEVVALDNDPLALNVARQNVERLNLGHAITLVQGDAETFTEGSFDLVTANIFLRENVSIIKNGAPFLKKGGIFIGSGITAEQIKDAEEALSGSPLHPLKMHRRELWGAFAAEKRQ
jgi:ribosomal protein L11 methyltransferase